MIYINIIKNKINNTFILKYKKIYFEIDILI